MELVNLLITAAISLLGLPAGMLLGIISEEELAMGKPYFRTLQILILVIAAVFFIFSLNLGVLSSVILSLLIAYLILKADINAILSYMLMLAIFVISIKDEGHLILTASLIFLYGLPTGSLIAARGFVRYMKEEIEHPVGSIDVWKKIRYILWILMMEILSIPAFFMKQKQCAEYHLKYICPICPSSRKKYRDVHGNSTCWWENNWRKGKYTIPKHFGMINWIRQYIGIGTNLKEFRGKNEKI